MFSFNIYNTDNTNPDLATGLIRWGPDPINGEYDPRFEWEGRGSHVVTLGGPPGVAKGRKHQDSGLFIQDRKIHIAGSDLNEALRTEIQAAYAALDTDYNFTDGLGEVFLVRFSRRPRGFSAVLNTPLYATGILTQNPPPEKYRRYTYELLLWIKSQEV